MRITDDSADFGIFNYWWSDDHGAILTAYALQEFLTANGYTSKLIKCWNRKYFNGEKRKNGISYKFEQKYLMSTKKEYTSYNDYFEHNNQIELNKKFKCFITGSDQVFRAEWVPDSWFLMFADQSRKLSVAASFGKSEITASNERLKAIGKSLRSFSAVSVRESSGVKICKDSFGVDAELILDPVFYINYDKLTDNAENVISGEYVFCYVRDNNAEISQMITRIAGSKKIINVNESMEVEDFLVAIKNAECVITDSYHGLCFSIIYMKNVLCIKNQKRGVDRFESLKDIIGLPDEMFVTQSDIWKINAINPIDYSEINSKLQIEAYKSKKWLKDQIRKII